MQSSQQIQIIQLTKEEFSAILDLHLEKALSKIVVPATVAGTMQESFLTAEQLANRLQVCTATIRARTKAGEIPSYEFSPRRTLYKESDIPTILKAIKYA